MRQTGMYHVPIIDMHMHGVYDIECKGGRAGPCAARLIPARALILRPAFTLNRCLVSRAMLTVG